MQKQDIGSGNLRNSGRNLAMFRQPTKREASGSAVKIGFTSGEPVSKSNHLIKIGGHGSAGGQSSMALRMSNDNTFSSGGLLHRQSSGDNQSSEIFELPLKRPKHTKLEKLDNPSAAQLRRQGSRKATDDKLGQKRAHEDRDRLADLQNEVTSAHLQQQYQMQQAMFKQKIPMKNQKRLREFVKSQRPLGANKPPKLNNLISKESPQGRGAPLP